MRLKTSSFVNGRASSDSIGSTQRRDSNGVNPRRCSAGWILAFAVHVLFSASSGAAPHPEGGDGSGLFVRLELPWTTLMAGESIQFQYILQNASDKPAPVAFPSAEHGFGWPAGGQPFLEAIPRRTTPELDILKAQWPPIDAVMGMGMEAWGELPPGQRIVWNDNRLPAGLFGVHVTKGLEAVQAHWLVGPGRWISSEPVPVMVVEVPLSERKKVFEAQWSSYGFGKDSRKGVAYTAPIGDRLYLFWKRSRVTEVASDDEFKYRIDKHGTNMEIAIKGNAGRRKLFYHLRHGLTRDTPWPIGSVKLFYPKPEPIPPAELAALRKRMSEQLQAPSDDGNLEGEPRRKPESASSSKTARNAGIAERNAWSRFLLPVLLLAAVATAALAIAKHRRKKRNGKKRE